jgi:hypothetical protein
VNIASTRGYENVDDPQARSLSSDFEAPDSLDFMERHELEEEEI